MATIKGNWEMNEQLSLIEFEESINFTSSGQNVTKMRATTTSLYYTFSSGSENTVYGSLGWEDNLARSVHFEDTEVEVSETFYNWFTANATEISSTGTTTRTVSGIWVFDDTIDTTPEVSQMVNYTSNGVNFTEMGVDSASGMIGILFYTNDSNTNAYSGSTSTWSDEAYKTVDFGNTSQTVSDDFYNWLTANATKSGSDDGDHSADDEHVDNTGETLRIKMTSKGGIKLLTKGKLNEKDITVVPVLEELKANGSGTFTPSQGHVGFSRVTITLTGDAPKYQEKTATTNGDVLPDDGYALSKVTVAIPTYAGDHESIN